VPIAEKCAIRVLLNYTHGVRVLFNKLIPISLTVLLSACGATQPPPYQKDKILEDRDQYNGLEGMAQYQKDQNYLVSKELPDKCTKAKIDLAVAETNKNVNEIKKQNSLISNTCIRFFKSGL
jgi:hypothetical protein